jgi:energy-coupling factor transport system ATP-binding protein
MIRFEQVTVTYPEAAAPTLLDVDLHVPEGELCLVVGRTGSGKSTLLRAVNGLVPHFTGGTLAGRVTVAGRDTATHPPRELADVVGVVGQDPSAGFVTDVVEDELAYGMESLGLAPDVMRRRVEETLDLLGLADLRARPLATLSGGQRQRVAIGSVLTAHPAVLVLDEPTSALDPQAAEEVLAALQRLVHDLGLTVLLAEHRLERVVQYADRLVHVPGDGAAAGRTARRGDGLAPIAPPVVELGRLAGWTRCRCRSATPAGRPATCATGCRATPPASGPPAGAGRGGLTTCDLGVRYGPVVALRGRRPVGAAGEVVALMGRNGAGKSTLLRASDRASRRPAVGAVRVVGAGSRHWHRGSW